jgi:hypothetical protein
MDPIEAVPRALGGRVHALACALALLAPAPAARGEPAREVDEQAQVWVSLNTTARLSDRWGLVADLHVRRDDFLAEPSFNLLRFGAHRWLTDSLTLTLGYAHNWIAPADADGETWIHENRIYQQIQHRSSLGRVAVLSRIRNEQRWKDEVVDDRRTGAHELTDRVRCLASFTVPISHNSRVPALVVSDEILLQFGPSVVLNTFDQNRFFTGIKRALGPSLSFDLGYMMVYQQMASGFEYDLNHTLRWFFYFTPDRRKQKARIEPAGGDE